MGWDWKCDIEFGVVDFDGVEVVVSCVLRQAQDDSELWVPIAIGIGCRQFSVVGCRLWVVGCRLSSLRVIL